MASSIESAADIDNNQNKPLKMSKRTAVSYLSLLLLTVLLSPAGGWRTSEVKI
jgi:hypothetical protein